MNIRETLKEVGYDVTIGVTGYLAAIQFNWTEEAGHMITGLISALVCCAGVHYFKKLLQWIDGKFKK